MLVAGMALFLQKILHFCKWNNFARFFISAVPPSCSDDPAFLKTQTPILRQDEENRGLNFCA
jgi:hypothetical protein